MKAGIIIQARTGSTRFPGKVTRQLGDSTVLGQVIKRCTRVDQRYSVILACPESDQSELGAIANYFGAGVFGGSELDVLDRYYQCAKKFELTHVVRITADCPFVDPDLIRMVVDVLLNNPQLDYVSNVGWRSFPKGFDIEAFKFEALARAHRNSTLEWDREHVGPPMRFDQQLTTANIRCPIPFQEKLRLVIDYPDDLEFARQLWPLLPANFGWRDILNVLESNPQIKNPREEEVA